MGSPEVTIGRVGVPMRWEGAMANTHLYRGERHVRLPYWRLQDAFEVLDARLSPDDPARRLMDPWLAHIKEELGFVLLDKALLEDRAGVRRLRETLAPLAEDLERGGVGFPPDRTARLDDVQGLRDAMAQTCRRLAAFLDEVMADQEAEDAGLRPPAVVGRRPEPLPKDHPPLEPSQAVKDVEARLRALIAKQREPRPGDPPRPRLTLVHRGGATELP